MREQRKLNNKTMDKFKICRGHGHFNNTPLFQVVGINNDYVGEWHTKKRSAKTELRELNK